MQQLTEASVDSLLRCWFADVRHVQIQPIAAGMSGSQLFRVRLEGSPNDWALKASPALTVLERLASISFWMHQAGKRCPLIVSALATRDTGQRWHHSMTRLWQCSRWVEGISIPHQWCETKEPTGALCSTTRCLSSGAAGIASAHEAMSQIAEARPGRYSPSLTDRQMRLRQLGQEIGRQSLPPREFWADQLQRRVSEWNATDMEDWPMQWADRLAVAHSQLVRLIRCNAVSRLSKQLDQAMDSLSHQATYLVFRDVHREHVLFETDSIHSASPKVVGIIDYDAVDRDHPAVDLARWVGDFHDAGPQIAEVRPHFPYSPKRFEKETVREGLSAALAGYRALRPLSTGQEQLAELLLDINPICALANWVQWGLSPRVRMTTPPRLVIDRMGRLIAAVDRIC